MSEVEKTRDELLMDMQTCRQEVASLKALVDERGRELQALRASDERYRGWVDPFPGVIYRYLDTCGGVFYSPQAESMLGYSLEYLQQHPTHWHDAIHPDDLPEVERKIREGAPSQRIDHEYRLRNAQGEWRWFLDCSRQITNAQGETLLEGLALDITDRKRAEEALQANEAMLDAIVENIPDMIFVKEAEELRFVRMNKAGEQLLGLDRSALIGKTDYDFFPGDEADLFTRVDRAVLEGGELIDTAEELIDTQELGQRVLHTKKVPLRDAQGRPRHLLGISEDITDRKRGERDLRRERDRAQLLLDIAGVGFVALNVQGRITLLNRKGCEILECTEDDAIGESWFTRFVPERQRQEVWDVFQGLMAGNPGVEFYENAVLTTSGQEKSVSFRNTITRNTSGEIDGILFSAEDVTERIEAEAERRRLEAQFHQAKKHESLGILAGGIAHDFNNILGGLLSNADLALRGLPGQSELHPLMEDIQQAARRAAELTAQMLAYSGKGHFVVEDVDLSAMVQGMTRLLESSISKKASMSFRLAPELPAVRADATQLRQLLLNLVTNASDAIQDDDQSPKDRDIWVETKVVRFDVSALDHVRLGSPVVGQRYVAIEVGDTGCGMDARIRERIFDPFFTTKFTGRGLGLAAVQGIIRGHKSALLVQSEPGAGSRFQVLLPALDQVVPAVVERPQADARTKGTGTILVVDDEALLRRASARLLKRLGYAVLLAADGVEAVELFREHHQAIRCVLLDLNMPRMGGEETFLKLRRIRGDIPVVLCSGYNERDLSVSLREQGLAGFVHKPYDLTALRRIIQEVLGDS